MPPLLQRDLLRELRAEAIDLHGRIAALVRPLDPEQLVRHPGPSGWSVAEVLEHLCVVDEKYAGPLATLIHRARADAGAPMREWKPTFMGGMIATRLAKPKPMRAPWWFRPGPTPRNGIVEDFLARESRLTHRMDEAASLDWRELKMAPPVIPPLFKFNLGDVFRIHVVHVRRHFAQMERVVAGLR